MSLLVRAAEGGRLPDPLLRWGIRRLCRRRLREQQALRRRDPAHRRHFVDALAAGPVAVAQDAANRQHYEMPPGFFERVLGPRLKYSCCHWPSGVQDLAAAEESMLELVAKRARLADGQRILDLGCGWGSLTSWLAERFPEARVVAVSNSAPQRRFIESRLAALGAGNVEVITADVGGLEQRPGTAGPFDRVVSIEMFEHVRNWQVLLGRIAAWLAPEGLAFLHVFCHREHAYLFEDGGDDDWMARHFFTGGLMPSDQLVRSFDRDLVVEEQWRVSGRHYQRTAEAWLDNLDASRDELQPLLAAKYGEADAGLWLQRWRLFFLACAELFGYRRGEEWWVTHCLLRPRVAPREPSTTVVAEPLHRSS
ncbi:MAG TPA: cyclopropane-fatty-acyl-phospholipid synthase family protein [Thermoanaerobaculia bacterium]|nr:cyclopropane-fatty-acyl-phospholipid synthase family protein [Thermoanaerobaculia bacterium]